MGNSFSKKTNTNDTKTLVFGYVRRMCRKFTTGRPPFDVINLIHKFLIRYQMFGIGDNFTGCFATGDNKNLTKFTRLKRMEELTPHIDNLYFRESNMFIITAQNELYWAGDSNSNNDTRYEWTKLELPDPLSTHGYGANYIPKFLSKKDATFVYTTNGDIYPTNDAMYPNSLCTDRTLHGFVNIKAIHIGNCAKLLLTNDGNVLCYGWDFDSFISNLCGLNNPTGEGRHIYEPQPVAMPDNAKITKIAVGFLQFLLISDKNELIVFGSNEKGRLGLEDKTIELLATPMIQPWFSKNNIKVRHIAGSYYCSLVISMENDCYMFGSNELGGIGNGKRDGGCVWRPYKVTVGRKSSTNYKFRDGDTTWQHTLLLTMDNEIVAFGGNEYNECSSIIKDLVIADPYVIDKSQELHIDHNCYIEKAFALHQRTLIVVNPAKLF